MSADDRRAKLAADLKRWEGMSDDEKRAWGDKRWKSNPPAEVELAKRAFGADGNPYYVWSAIDICSQNNLNFPDWVLEYLAIVAQSMTSPEAAHMHDLRKALPYILGFEMKRGRGNLLNPTGGDEDDLLLALKFAVQIGPNGAELEDALAIACEGLDRNLADKDTKTLIARIKKVFGITSSPSSSAEWIEAMNPWFIYMGKVIREFTP
jgi:hypothetical protein